MQMTFEGVLADVTKITADLWDKGWAEANAGNISLRVERAALSGAGGLKEGPWQELPGAFGDLGGELFLVSGTGKYLRNVEIVPEDNLGLLELDAAGGRYRLVWGYASGGAPTSELIPHLQVHSVRKRVSGGRDRAIIHTHCPNLVALGHSRALDTVSLTRLLWQMHTECLIVFPEGVEFVLWRMPGSAELAAASAVGFERRRAVAWQFHGVMAVGEDLDRAFGLIHTIEKTCEIYAKVVALGGVHAMISKEQLCALAEHFGVQPDEEIFGQID